MTPPLQLRALRGATTAEANTAEAIASAVAELVDALMHRNRLDGSRLLSVTFSVTADLDACFPAAVARRREGWDGVALLDCQQMAVAGDLPRCIRLLAHAWLEPDRIPDHPYLREASRLRPDRAHPAAATSPSDHFMPEG
ncbi:chorismate mutase [Cyanobium sp. FGCU-52]|nr:chorismate mutase [Cyanobium sp. FGCU52]